MKEDEPVGTLQQDLSEEAKFEALFSIYLLFKEQGQRPTAEVLAQALSAALGQWIWWRIRRGL